jgi:hypothetical protein
VARRSRKQGDAVERFASRYLDPVDVNATNILRRAEPPAHLQHAHKKSLRYRVALSDGYNGIVAPGNAIIETRYRGRTATWSVGRLGEVPVTVGGHYDPVERAGDEVHDPATCPECLAAAAEEAAEAI